MGKVGFFAGAALCAGFLVGFTSPEGGDPVQRALVAHERTARAAPVAPAGGGGDTWAALERDHLARERRLADEAWREGVELGIARRFERAPTGLGPGGIRRAVVAVVRESRAVGLDPLLVAGVIAVESSFRNHAVSPVGAVGLMQVMPATGAWFGEKIGQPGVRRDDLFDPELNVRLGVRYLAYLLERFGRLDHALVAYNAGPTKARRVLAGPAAADWLDGYPRKVLGERRRLEGAIARR